MKHWPVSGQGSIPHTYTHTHTKNKSDKINKGKSQKKKLRQQIRRARAWIQVCWWHLLNKQVLVVMMTNNTKREDNESCWSWLYQQPRTHTHTHTLIQTKSDTSIEIMDEIKQQKRSPSRKHKADRKHKKEDQQTTTRKEKSKWTAGSKKWANVSKEFLRNQERLYPFNKHRPLKGTFTNSHTHTMYESSSDLSTKKVKCLCRSNDKRVQGNLNMKTPGKHLVVCHV